MLKDQRGTVMLEMIVSLPVLLSILLIVAYAGLAFEIWTDISFAAREGARYGAITDSNNKAINRAKLILAENAGVSESEIDNKYEITAKKSKGAMTVTVEKQGKGFDISSCKSFRLIE